MVIISSNVLIYHPYLILIIFSHLAPLSFSSCLPPPSSSSANLTLPSTPSLLPSSIVSILFQSPSTTAHHLPPSILSQCTTVFFPSTTLTVSFPHLSLRTRYSGGKLLFSFCVCWGDWGKVQKSKHRYDSWEKFSHIQCLKLACWLVHIM